MKELLKRHYPIILSYLSVTVLGVIFHFMYDLLSQPVFLKPFLPIDESVFEHLKLLFYPVIIVSCIELIIRKEKFTSLIPFRMVGTIIASLLLVVFFYAYTSLNDNKPIVAIDIISYFIFVGVGYVLSYIFFNHFLNNKTFNIISYILIISIFFMFALFSFYKPNIPLFTEI